MSDMVDAMAKIEKLKDELHEHKKAIYYLLDLIDRIEERFEICELTNDDFYWYQKIAYRKINI